MGPCMARRGSLRQGRVECVISGVDMTTEPDGIRQNDSMQAPASSGPPWSDSVSYSISFYLCV